MDPAPGTNGSVSTGNAHGSESGRGSHPLTSNSGMMPHGLKVKGVRLSGLGLVAWAWWSL